MQTQIYKVLLVEDDEDDFLLMKVFLCEAALLQVQLDWVDSYEKALGYVEQHSPDMFMIDYNLNSVRTGLDLVQELKEDGADIPVILVTGQDQKAMGLDGAFALLDGYINKNELTSKLLADLIAPFLS